MSSEINIRRHPDFHEAREVCQALFEDSYEFTIKLIRLESQGSVGQVTYSHGRLADQVRQFPKWRAEQLQPFMMVGTSDGQGVGSSNVLETWAIAVDLDRDVDMSQWEQAAFRPTIAINTSDNRQHMLWVLKDSIDRDTHRQAARALAYRLDGDMCFAHQAQAIRLPGFVNAKHGNEVRLSMLNSGRTYDYARLAAAFDFDLVRATVQATVPFISNTLAIKVRSSDETKKRLEDLKDSLRHISSDSYDVWFKVLAALRRAGPDGESVAREWSKSSKKFDESAFSRKWNDVEKVTGISPGSIFLMAARNGWRNPGHDSPTINMRQPITERTLGRMLAPVMDKEFAVARLGRGDKQTLQALKWDGHKYAEVDQFAFRQCVEDYCKRLSVGDDEDARRALSAAIAKHTGDVRALDSLGRSTLEFLLSRSDSLHATKYPYFPVANGILNLLSGQLLPSHLRAVSLRHSAVVFDPSAGAPRFIRFLEEIFEGDHEIIRFLLRLVGCMLLGKPVDHAFVIFHGPQGRNGKSVLVEVLAAIFGDFASNVGVATIMVKSTLTDGPTSALARLEGRRLVIINEPNGKHQLDAGLVKQLTGGDRITARPLYGAEVEFLPEFVPIMVTNFIPKIHAADEALWARIKIIRFMRTFSPDEIDLGLKDKLLSELPGILNMFLAGAADYLEGGLRPPCKVSSAGQEQRKLADGFEAWLDERAMRGDYECQFKPLYDDYVTWAKLNSDFDRLSQKEFKAKLEGQFRSRKHRNHKIISGITLNDAV
ncbi:hypothetical protein CEK29_05505 [Bordetella genomosp. 5]|uniref:phage/plasmid primase, P4 family n=1 Tax=Bordetella genomosp. 5 TaxID=1395608 RepID=UPI000B9E3C53|nr:phage/plasmid primase, P4 family [Bordetella genomosp. 5]OZI46327.1 hypothetical protein CEK29_05505 [Bordetella genomosp. 5]